MKVQNFYENLSTLHVGTMDNRCWYVPKQDGRESQILLSGDDWKFAWYPSVEEVPEHFWEKDLEKEGFINMEVPSCWQMKGFGQKQYTNIRYPIPYDPPYAPGENPSGAYVKDFTLTEKEAGERQFLYFEGVDSCFYVWINGEFVGYSQVSHSPSEFEITGKTKAGSNRMAVLVLKWCDGTYLEDQDKLRFPEFSGMLSWCFARRNSYMTLRFRLLLQRMAAQRLRFVLTGWREIWKSTVR